MPKFSGRAGSRAPHTKLLGQRIPGDATGVTKSRDSRVNRAPLPGRGAQVGRAPQAGSAALKDIIKGKLSAKQRVAATLSKKERRRAFNLDDDEGEETETLVLKGGRSVFEMSRQDIAAALDNLGDKGLQFSDDEQSERQLDAGLTGKFLFGAGRDVSGHAGHDADAGNDDDVDGDEDEGVSASRKRLNRKEKLAELIKSSKQQRLANSQLRHQQASLLESTNDALKTVLNDLDFRPAKNTPAYTKYVKEQQDLEEIRDVRSALEKSRDDDFDRLTRELAVQPTGQASDRVKSLFERKLEETRSQQLEEERRAAELARASKLLRTNDLLHATDDSESDDDDSESDGDDSETDSGTPPKHTRAAKHMGDSPSGLDNDSTGSSSGSEGPFSEYGTDSDIDSKLSG
ncbi:Nop14-like family protein [Gregarina niphandrodes]|uniref:Nop14-like family protein n=1 Tax=Gregarina niphandrodes TaxID=110365 RepID=A0A023B0L4_GRENI|nr:Nop14-like family protein [Gregarina niphandrodes]EZG45426.1 Nop14-like family protein [Gregarina niphandrodes]|eukprot:XP_011132502.1 Nop14-like family protein [Gregarina niphandrodes]